MPMKVNFHQTADQKTLDRRDFRSFALKRSAVRARQRDHKNRHFRRTEPELLQGRLMRQSAVKLFCRMARSTVDTRLPAHHKRCLHRIRERHGRGSPREHDGT